MLMNLIRDYFSEEIKKKVTLVQYQRKELLGG